jgi:hypothetical protein
VLHPAVAGRRQRHLDRRAQPGRTHPQAQQSGSLKQFLIAFAVSYLVGYLVNIMLVWRAFAARDLPRSWANNGCR